MPYRLRELKLWISEQSGPSASLDDLFSVVLYFGLTLPRAREILKEILSAVANWRKTSRSALVRLVSMEISPISMSARDRVLLGLIERMERDEFDLIAVGRALISNPDWAAKMAMNDRQGLKAFDAAALSELV